jgi:hypothetical protein
VSSWLLHLVVGMLLAAQAAASCCCAIDADSPAVSAQLASAEPLVPQRSCCPCDSGDVAHEHNVAGAPLRRQRGADPFIDLAFAGAPPEHHWLAPALTRPTIAVRALSPLLCQDRATPLLI